MSEDVHKELLNEALRLEADGHRALLEGRQEEARDDMRAASDRYRASWEAAPPRAYGRLVGMLKAAVIAGEGETAARYAHSAIGDAPDSPTSAYAVAIAALVHGDDDLAERSSAAMRDGSSAAFGRAADAIAALARRDASAYRAAVEAIVADFTARDDHLTGVPIADTALMLERLAVPRGMATGLHSPLLPAG